MWPAAADEQRRGYPGWRVAAACGVGVFFAATPLTTFGVFLRPICDAFSWSRQSASLAYGTLTLAAAVTAPLLGRLLDRVGPQRVIVPCLALSGAGVASLCALTSSLVHLRAVFAVLGVAMIGASPVACSRVIFSWFDSRRGRALGLMLTGAALSTIVMPPAAHALVRSFGWRSAWLALGVATLSIAVPISARFVRERGRPGTGANTPASGARVRDALQSRVFWTLTAVVLGSTMATNGAVVHMVALLSDRGVPVGRAALAASAMGGASVFGRLFTGWLLDRFPGPRVSMGILTVGACGAFLLAAAHSVPSGVIAALFIGFGSGGEMDVMPFLLARYFGLRSIGTIYGLNWTAWGLGGALGPALLGRAFDATGSYTTTLVEFGCLTLAAAALMATLPRPAALPALQAVPASSAAAG
jgi:MFS family permease